MANKNLIRRMRQLLILVLVLAMTMSFAAMTAMAGNGQVRAHIHLKNGDLPTGAIQLTISELNENGEWVKRDVSGTVKGNGKLIEVELGSNNGISTVSARIEYVDANHKTGVITIMEEKQEGNSIGEDGIAHPEEGENNYWANFTPDEPTDPPTQETGSLTIEKVLQNADGTKFTGTEAPSFEFTVEDSEGKSVTDNPVVVTAGSSKTIEGLKVGAEYTVTESVATGYELVDIDGGNAVSTSRKTTVTVEADKPITVTFTNRVTSDDSGNTPETGSLTIAKVLQNADGTKFTGTEAPSFEFTVEDSEGKSVTDNPVVVTAGSSKTIEGLKVGAEYTVTESVATGYELVDIDGGNAVSTSRKTTVTVEADKTITVTFTNKVTPEDPGESGNGGGNSGGGGLVTPPQKPLPPEQNLDVPETPVEPETPAEPVEPSDKPLPDDKHIETEVPKTGDVGTDALTLNLLLLSISALAGTAFYLRRKTSGR